MEFRKRWYDLDPKISLAVECIEKCDEITRNNVAHVMIENALLMGVEAERPLNTLLQRWYDVDMDLCLAMEYFKNCNEQQRETLAEQIIVYIAKQTNSYAIS